MKTWLTITSIIFLLGNIHAQTWKEDHDSLVLTNNKFSVILQLTTGKVTYRFPGGIVLDNTIAYIDDLHYGRLSSPDFSLHPYSIDQFTDSLGKGAIINIRHMDDQKPLYLLQRITVYEDLPYVLTKVEAGTSNGQGPLPETRNISPLAILPTNRGQITIPGAEPRLLDVPFDNDSWTGVVERRWPNAAGISYELSAIYDNNTFNGIVIGSVQHDFWKTGISYWTGSQPGLLDSFTVYGGVATPDNPALPAAYGGQDGTHDHMLHGTSTGTTVSSPLVFIDGGADVRSALQDYGEVNARINGRLNWKGYAPFYWNSFGVEGVLGYTKVMMPPGVGKISDFIHSLDNFNHYAPPVLSIDSYDQSIYTTDLLASLGRYGKKHHQDIGFYFTPFTIWTWKNTVDQTNVPGTNYTLKEVMLKDANGQPIAYKDGDWGAFPLDPTHPATRQLIIGQLQKAKAIGATFVKIDFLTGGALESATRYDRSVRSGIQAYNYGMRMLKHLMDSILGPDIFITQAISPLFPSQYAHARFNSTDVYSHLRDDEPGFPHWGSTEASLATGSHMGWVQGTLLPYTNLDVTIMKSFEKNPDLSEREIKVRLYALMVMGSILGDGSDYRQPLAAERAKKFLDNKNVCEFFSRPKAFTPIRWADGDSLDQQLAFFLKKPALAAVFNFNLHQPYTQEFKLKDLGLSPGSYKLRDFLTGQEIGAIAPEATNFYLSAPPGDATLIKIEPE